MTKKKFSGKLAQTFLKRRSTTTRLLCIDPGTRKMGVAIFELDGKGRTGRLLKCFVETVVKKHKWQDRIDMMAGKAIEICNREKPDRVLIEEPRLFLSTRKGQAASNSGAVLKLVGLVYCMAGALGVVKDREVVMVPVQQWKGNVPKEITQRRVVKYWGCRSGDDNITDAVGIGDWYIRKQLKYKPE